VVSERSGTGRKVDSGRMCHRGVRVWRVIFALFLDCAKS